MQPAQAELGCFWAYVGVIIVVDREYDAPDTPETTYDCCLIPSSHGPSLTSHWPPESFFSVLRILRPLCLWPGFLSAR